MINAYSEAGFHPKDQFVLIQRNRPRLSRLLGRQFHARKNSSFFLAFVKPRAARVASRRPGRDRAELCGLGRARAGAGRTDGRGEHAGSARAGAGRRLTK